MKNFVFRLKVDRFFPKGPIDNNPALDEIMATSHFLTQCWSSSLTHICDTIAGQGKELNKSRPKQNGRHIAEDIFKCTIRKRHFPFCCKFQWNLFLDNQMTKKSWLEVMACCCHYLNQYRPTSVPLDDVIMLHWIDCETGTKLFALTEETKIKIVGTTREPSQYKDTVLPVYRSPLLR